MPGSIPPKGMGPGRGVGPGKSIGPGKSMGPPKMGRKSMALNKGSGRGGTGGPSSKDPSMVPKGIGPFGRIPNVDKDGDPFTKRPPYKKPGNNSFF